MPPVASASFWGWRQRNLTYGVFATLKALQSLRRVPYPNPYTKRRASFESVSRLVQRLLRSFSQGLGFWSSIFHLPRALRFAP
jgi:hypothetical protein